MSAFPDKDLTWFLRIEGLGDNDASTATNKLFRWSTAPVPSWDSDSLYRHTISDLELDAQTVDPRSGKSSSGGCEFVMINRDDNAEEVRSLFFRRQFVPVGNMTTELTPTTTTITIGSYTSGANETVFINREAIKLGSHAGFGTYNGCTRGILETRAQVHKAPVPVYPYPRKLQRRRVTVCYYPEDATGYTDEVEVSSYQLWDYKPVPGMAAIKFECDGFVALLKEAEVLPDQWTGRAHLLWRDGTGQQNENPEILGIRYKSSFRDGGIRLPDALQSGRSNANGGNSSVRGGTPAEPADGDSFYVSINGTIYEAVVASYEADGETVTNFMAWVRLDALPFGGTPLNITSSTDLTSLDIREVIISDTGAPTNNGSGSAQLPLGTSGQHPLTIWLQVVTSTSGGDNGGWDVGIDLGGRIPVEWVDTDAIENMIATDGEAVRAPRFFIGRERKKEKLLKYLDEQLLKPAGIVRTHATDGRISFSRITSTDYLNTATSVGENELVKSHMIEPTFNVAGELDRIVIQYAQDGSGVTSEIPIGDLENVRDTLGPNDRETFDGNAFLNRDLVYAAGVDYLTQWRNGIDQLNFATTFDVNVRAGDAVLLTSDAVPGWDKGTDTVVEGVTSSRVWISSRRIDIRGGFIEYEGYHIGLGQPTLAGIAPAFRVSGANTGTSVPVDAAHFVGTDHVLGYTDDIDPWTVGDSCSTRNPDLSVKESGLTIGSLASGTVVVTGLTVAVAAGDFIVPDLYDASTNTQADDWGYYADAAGQLGAAGDPGKEYEQ